MKRAASAEDFLPDIDLKQDYPVRFRDHEAKRARHSSDESSYFSIACKSAHLFVTNVVDSKKVQNPESLVPTLLTVKDPEHCTLEVNDESVRHHRLQHLNKPRTGGWFAREINWTMGRWTASFITIRKPK